MKYRGVALLLVASLLSPAFDSHSVEQINNDWTMPLPPDSKSPSSGIVFMEPTLYPNSLSYLTAFDGSGKASWANNLTTSACDSLDSEPCKSANQVSYKAYLPKCENETDNNCIESFYLIHKEQQVEGLFDSYMPRSSEYHFKGDLNANLPSGSSSSLWQISNSEINPRPIQFAISAILYQGTIVRSLNEAFRFGAPNIEVTIDPVEIIQGAYAPPIAGTNGWTISGCLQQGCDEGSSEPRNYGYCSAVDSRAIPRADGLIKLEGTCAKRVSPPSGVSYGIQIRMSKTPEGWIHGRLADPRFTIKETNGGATWTVEGSPVNLPVISGWVSNSLANSKLGFQPTTKPEQTSWSGPYSSGLSAISTFEKWTPVLGNKAQAIQQRWSFRTLSWEDRESSSPLKSCFKPNTVAGLVVTNATVYQGAPPEWSAADSSLNYKVAAPHLSVDGNPFLGLYTMKLNTDFANCIYGISGKDVKATISVVTGDGELRSATTSLTSNDGWLNFSAAGFTFSAPTIKVKLESAEAAKSSTAGSSANPTTKDEMRPEEKSPLEKVIKKAITCSKGKSKVRVVGKNPVCPKGFKKVKT